MLRQRLAKFRFLGPLVVAVLLIPLFQNCGNSGGFSTLQVAGTSPNLGSSTTGSVTPTPTPGTNPTMTPTPAPSATLKKTYFYFGRNKGVDALELDHSSGQIRQLASVAFNGATVGWMSYDGSGNSVVAADAGGTVLQVYAPSLSAGTLSSVNAVTNFAASVVHLSMVPSSTGFDLFSASYDRGVLDYYKMNAAKTQVTSSQSVSFGNGAKTHSSAFDSKRSLLYVASLGLNRIDVYKFSSATGLSALTSIAVDGVRTLVYDTTYDKLYASTEMYAGNSYIRIFSIAAAGASYSFTDAGSLSMPLAGGDLKVNHAFGFVMATAREAGKEAILGLPVTDQGVQDSTRPSFSIAVSQAMPRALEVTADGQYAVVGMNSVTAENVVAYKLSFDGQKKYVSSQKIFQSHIDSGQGYICGLSIPVY